MAHADEILGPVLSVLTFTREDEAIRLANAVGYGLTASVWTRDLIRAHRFAAGVGRVTPTFTIQATTRRSVACHETRP